MPTPKSTVVSVSNHGHSNIGKLPRSHSHIPHQTALHHIKSDSSIMNAVNHMPTNINESKMTTATNDTNNILEKRIKSMSNIVDNASASMSSDTPNIIAPNATINTTASGSGTTTTTAKNPSSWDPQDDLLLRHLKEIKKLGWKEISHYFKNRTPNACQFRWRRLKSGNLKSNKTATIDVSELPGMIKSLSLPNSGNNSKESSLQIDDIKMIERNMSNIVPTENTSMDAANRLIIPSSNKNHSNTNNNGNHNINNSGFHNSVAMNRKFSHDIASLPVHTSPQKMDGPRSDSVSKLGSKFIKPRSYSHNNTRPQLSNSNNYFQTNTPQTINSVFTSEEENIGFIPKIIVRSRRSSTTHLAPIPMTMNSPSNSQPSSNLVNALNTTLNTTKSRKNSFTVQSRRSSFNVSSNTTSRRSSIIVAPTSASIPFGMNYNNNCLVTPKQRRDSVIGNRKEFYPHQFPNSYGFADLPSAGNTRNPSLTSREPSNRNLQQNWSHEDDLLLLELSSRNLSLKEISILLTDKTEDEIKWRLTILHSEHVDPLHNHSVRTEPQNNGKHINGELSNSNTPVTSLESGAPDSKKLGHLPSINTILQDMI